MKHGISLVVVVAGLCLLSAALAGGTEPTAAGVGIPVPLPHEHSRSLRLANDTLEVSLSSELPIVFGYEHRPTGARMAGADTRGVLVLNGTAVPWGEWTIGVNRNASEVVYAMSLPAMRLTFDFAFALKGSALGIELCNIHDPDQKLRTIQWKDLPLLTCNDPDYRFWRLTTGGPDAGSGGKMWMHDRAGQIRSAGSEGVPAIRGCLYRPDKACVFIDSNYPLFPQLHQLNAGTSYHLSLNTYQHRVRSKTMPPLRAQVVFLRDENGDGRSDLSDYCLWINRRLPDADPLYRTHLWYKILLQEPTAGIRTTFRQAEDIVRAIHNVTDGLPQLVYLVGWQYEGHDTGYPAMDKVNEHIGGEAGLRSLVQASKERYHTLISYHCNIDDTYATNRAHDPTIVADNGNLSHCLDTESGKIFRRLEALMRVALVEQTIHFDNTRITSPVAAQGIGILEELECGLRPVDAFLKARGITMTTEGQNGIPVDCSGLFSAFWHYDTTLPTVQLWHRKILGGGWGSHMGPQSRYELGLGSSIHQDVSYLPIDREALGDAVWKKYFSWMNGPRGLTVSFTKDWDDLVDRIYRGTLLYHFYLEREMTRLERVPGGVRQEYGNREVIVDNANHRLKVTWGNVLVADDDDRFVPRGDAVYAYSLAGSERDWTLPERLTGKKLEVFTLGSNGRGPAPQHRLERDRIHLKLAPRTPVKIAAHTESAPTGR